MIKEHRGLVYAVLTCFCASLSAIFVRWAQEAPVTTIVFVRFLIGSLWILPLFWKGKVVMNASSIRKHTFRAVLGLITIWCFFYTLMHLTIMNAVTFSNTAPLFLPVVVFFWMRKIIPKTRFFALLLGFIGVVIILRPSPEMQISAACIGLFGGFISSLVQIGIRQLSKTESADMILAHYFVIATIITLFPMIYFWEPIVSPKLWLNLIAIGVISTLMQSFLTRSLHYAPATKVGAINYISVPLGGLVGWWFFGEIPSLWTLLGTLLIMCGGIIAIASKKEARHRDSL